MKSKIIENHERSQDTLALKDQELKEQIAAAKAAKKYLCREREGRLRTDIFCSDTLIHQLELDRLRLLFQREAADLALRQEIQSTGIL